MQNIEPDSNQPIRRDTTMMLKKSAYKWAEDADNGLSLEQMRYVTDLRHPRRVEQGKRMKFSWCGTSTGWYCCCRCGRNSDLRELGAGITVYFKMLKYLMCLFLWFSFLSVPAYFFYYTGNESGVQDKSIKYYLSALSLGNIGSCNYSLTI